MFTEVFVLKTGDHVLGVLTTPDKAVNALVRYVVCQTGVAPKKPRKDLLSRLNALGVAGGDGVSVQRLKLDRVNGKAV